MDINIYTKKFKPKQNIYVIGYFGHANTGDEQYTYTFDYVFDTFLPNNETYNILYIDCDHVKITTFIDSDIIILGGGDVLNNYFLDQIISKFINRPNKIIAVSVGIPYTDIIINTNKLNIIDYIFARTHQDLELFKIHFHPHRVFFIPDLSFFMLNIINEEDKKYKIQAHEQTSEQISEQTLEQILVQTPEQTPEQILEQILVQTPVQISEQT